MNKIIRQVHKIDASGQSVGRLASRIAVILRGKNKPEYNPSLDLGDIVEVSHLSLLKFTGKKLEQKHYHKYSGYPGGLKTVKMKNLMNDKPAEILRRAVKQMLPANKLRINQLKRIIIK